MALTVYKFIEILHSNVVISVFWVLIAVIVFAAKDEDELDPTGKGLDGRCLNNQDFSNLNPPA